MTIDFQIIIWGWVRRDGFSGLALPGQSLESGHEFALFLSRENRA